MTEINRNFEVLCAGARVTLISSANFDSTHTHTYSGSYAFSAATSTAVYERFPVRASLLASLQLQIVRYTLLLLLSAYVAGTYIHTFTYIHVHVYVCSYCAALNGTCHICALPDVAPAPEEDALWPLLTSYGTLHTPHAPVTISPLIACSAFASRTALSIKIAACLSLFLSIYFALTSARGRHKRQRK